MKMLRILLRAVLGLLVFAIAVLAALLVHGGGLLSHRQANAAQPLRVAPDSSLVARGAALSAVACAGCHAPQGETLLSGGTVNLLAIPKGPTFGVLLAPNLTPAGMLHDHTDAELGRAIREGVGHDRRALLVMPSKQFHGMSDRDLAAVIAHLRTQPASGQPTPRRSVNLLGRLVLGLHLFELSNTLPVDHPIADVPAGPTPEYGAYLVGLLGCRDCHGADLRGGRDGQLPPKGPDLLALASAHDATAFELALRRGVSARDGHALDPEQMPFASYSRLSDDDVEAIFAALRAPEHLTPPGP